MVPTDECPRGCEADGAQLQPPIEQDAATAVISEAAESVTGDLLDADLLKERTGPGRIVGHLARDGFVRSLAAALQHEFMA